MGRAIAVMKQHGFHEPMVVGDWKVPESEPLVVKARALGINIEKILTAGNKPRAYRAWASSLKSEIRAVEEARKTPWNEIEDGNIRQRVRAIQAEKQRNDMQHEAAMLKERLKQADNGAGDWVEEREALLAQIASLEAKLAEIPQDSSPRIQELQEQNARQADSIQSLQEQVKVTSALAAENTELHRTMAEWQETLEERRIQIEELEAKIKGWEEAFKDTVKNYQSLRKDYEGYFNRNNLLESDLAGYREANRKLVDANEQLQEQLDSADQREALPDEVQWLRSQVSVLIEKLR